MALLLLLLLLLLLRNEGGLKGREVFVSGAKSTAHTYCPLQHEAAVQFELAAHHIALGL